MEKLSHNHSGYYPHIDGLRAFAVLAVLVYHAFPNLCSGGFMGVDVFFVISGYLITLGLLNDLKHGNYSIKRFYVKRIRRILPAYLAVIVFAAILAFMVLYGRELVVFSETAFSSGFFLTNFYFASHADYFSANAHENALLNLWSLSVEEQFYIIFPLCLALLHRILPGKLKVILWGGFCVTLLLSVYSVNVSGGAIRPFYWLPYRAWELLAGCLLALHCGQKFVVSKWGIVVLVIMCCSFYGVSMALPFPGAVALVPVLCAVGVIMTGQSGYARLILEHPCTVFIGKISYSLYLFHWPILVFCRCVSGRDVPSEWVGIIAIVLSLGASVLSWKYVETPIRNSRWKSSRYFAFAVGVFAVVSGIAVLLGKIGKYQLQHPVVRFGASSWCGKNAKSLHTPDVFSLKVLGKDQDVSYCLWGDSHAAALIAGFHEFSQKNNINGVFITRGVTLARFTNYAGSNALPKNSENIEAVLKYLRQTPQLKTVVLSNRWACTETGTWNESRGYWYPVRIDGKKGSHEELFYMGLKELCEEICAMGKKVIIVASVPEQGSSIPKELGRFAGITGKPSLSFSLPLAEYEARQHRVVKCFRRLEELNLATIIWVQDIFYPNGNPIPLLRHSNSLYVDDDHLSAAGSQFLIEQRTPQLIKLLSQ